MKKIALALIGLSVVTAGYCGVGEETGNTTCYLYKDNKLTQTVKCKYDHTEGSSSSYMTPAVKSVHLNLGDFNYAA